ncbi:hypothetical protein BDW22DRAFT_450661 [Trametopsis cervina]|nr:hypothetical protein BDW22DRAFT_450661 [Trametopsis cervina]
MTGRCIKNTVATATAVLRVASVSDAKQQQKLSICTRHACCTWRTTTLRYSTPPVLSKLTLPVGRLVPDARQRWAEYVYSSSATVMNSRAPAAIRTALSLVMSGCTSLCAAPVWRQYRSI